MIILRDYHLELINPNIKVKSFGQKDILYIGCNDVIRTSKFSNQARGLFSPCLPKLPHFKINGAIPNGSVKPQTPLLSRADKKNPKREIEIERSAIQIVRERERDRPPPPCSGGGQLVIV